MCNSPLELQREIIFSPENLSEAFRAGGADRTKINCKARLLLYELMLGQLHVNFCEQSFRLFSW